MEGTICFTLPAWISMQGLNFVRGMTVDGDSRIAGPAFFFSVADFEQQSQRQARGEYIDCEEEMFR